VGSAPLLDHVGRRPSRVTLPWHELLGRVRRNEGLRYASDPPAIRVVVDVAGAYDGEEHDAGDHVYLDEQHAWHLQRQAMFPARAIRSSSFATVSSPGWLP